MEKAKKAFKFWSLPVGWASIIFILSSTPTKEVTEIYWQDFIIKKTFHLIEYGLLFLLLFRALKNTYKENLFKLALIAFALTIFYGASDEYHQTLVSGRQGMARDVLIDGFGAGLTWLGLWKWLPKAPKKLKNWAKRLAII
jgi:hypothetical protein